MEQLGKAQKQMTDLLSGLKGQLGPVAKAWETYDKSLRDAADIGQRLIKLGAPQVQVMNQLNEARKRSKDILERTLDTLEREADISGQVVAALEEEVRLSGMSAEARKVEEIVLQAVADARELATERLDEELALNEEEQEALRKTVAEKLRMIAANDKLADAQQYLNDVVEEYRQSPFEKLVSEVDRLREAFIKAAEAAGDMGDPERLKALQAALGDAKQQTLLFATDAIGQGISSLQSLATEGSKAYKALAVAQAASNVVAAIGAILNQGKGDPYTAFARMAAMAAAVAGLVGSIGSFSAGGGGGAHGAESRQAAQGRGSVLGDADAQSESMLNALEITAGATSELVGLNRGMLNALQAMQAGIGSAAGSLARTGFADLDLGGANTLGLPSGSILGRLAGSIFGGDQDLIDQGLMVRGGSFGSVSRNPNASSYQTIETDGGWFSSDDIDDELEALGEAASTQIRLILQSIGDAVREGARALGMDMEEVNRAIEAFKIEEIRISTMDLTGEEAQKELEAAFSRIFDDLAGHIVPFIDQFQRVGEGLGETLVRVATSVQVAQEAFYQLGLSVDEMEPERLAQVSVALVDAMGGIEEFIDGLQNFVANFAPEAHRFEIAQDELTRALAQVGLTLPATRQGMWDLMQTLDATTESGAQQIATLLRLSGTADAYYTTLEQRAEEAAEAAAEAARVAQEAEQARLDELERMAEVVRGLMIDMHSELASAQREIDEFNMSPLARQLAQIDRETREAIATAAANNASPAQLLVLEIIGLGRAAAATRLAAMELSQALEEWEFEDALTGMSELEQQIARSDRVWQERLRQTIEVFGEGSEEATRVIALWGNATRRFTEEAEAAARATVNYTGNFSSAKQSIQEILQEARIGVRGDGMTDMQRAIKEVNDRFGRFAEDLRRSLDGVSASPGARAILEGQVAAGLQELEALRLEALRNLELEGTADVVAAAEERYRLEMEWLQRLGSLLDSIMLDQQVTTLTPAEQMAEAQRQYDQSMRDLAAARLTVDTEDDVAARAAFESTSRALLNIARDYFGSSDAYTSIFNQVTSDIRRMMEESPAAQVQATVQNAIAAAAAQTNVELQARRQEADEQTNAVVARLEAIESSSAESNALLQSAIDALNRIADNGFTRTT
jgi:hypothetical protein